LDAREKVDTKPARPPRAADVQQVLQTHEALVEYAVVWWPQYHQGAKPPVDLKKAASELHYVAYVLRRDGTISGFDLGDVAVIHDAIVKYRSIAESGASKQEVSDSAHTLHRLLWKPIQPALAGADTESGHVYIAPDADLALLPFDGLIDDQNRYLVQTWNISYLTSGRQLVEMHSWSQGKGKVVVFADHQAPIDQQEGSSLADANRPANTQIRAGGLAREYPPLLATGLEAKAIATAMPDVTLLYTGRDATKQELKTIPAPKVLHLAVHGYFVDGDAPLPSNPNDVVIDKKKKYGFLRYGLILNSKDDRPTDRILTSLEISMLNLDLTDLVVLSACDSGVGDTTPGDNVSGLRTAFQMAGAKAVVSSLWTVDDVRGKEFMAEFYKRLAAGADKHASINESLRQTKLSMIERSREPYYWASFVLDGKDQVLRF
jgi:CHAT domain-containing protein